MPSLKKITPLLAAALFTAACTPSSDPETKPASQGSGAEKSLIIYSYRQLEELEPLLSRFTQETGITTEVSVYRGDGLVDLYQQTPSQAKADLLILVDALRMQAIAETGELRTFPEAILAAIPEGFKSHKGDWLGLGWRARGPVRTSAVELQPDYLALPEQGTICVRAGEHVYNRGFLAWLLEAKGEAVAQQWVEQVHQLRPGVEGGDRDQMAAMLKGECQLTFMNHYYLARMQESENPEVSNPVKDLIFGWPDADYAVQSNVSGIALTRQGNNPMAAEQLANWLVQPHNLEDFAATFYEFPVTWPNHGGEISASLEGYRHLKPAAPLPADYVHQASKARELLALP